MDFINVISICLLFSSKIEKSLKNFSGHNFVRNLHTLHLWIKPSDSLGIWIGRDMGCGHWTQALLVFLHQSPKFQRLKHRQNLILSTTTT